MNQQQTTKLPLLYAPSFYDPSIQHNQSIDTLGGGSYQNLSTSMQSVDKSQHQRMSTLTKQQISQYMMSDLMVPKSVAMKTPAKNPAQKFINMVDYNRRDQHHHQQTTERKTSSIEKYQTMSLSGFKGSTLSRAKDHSPPGAGWT